MYEKKLRKKIYRMENEHMAEFSRNFKNCRVMVRDIDTGKLFVDTVIEKHDVQSNINYRQRRTR